MIRNSQKRITALCCCPLFILHCNQNKQPLAISEGLKVAEMIILIMDGSLNEVLFFCLSN